MGRGIYSYAYQKDPSFINKTFTNVSMKGVDQMSSHAQNYFPPNSALGQQFSQAQANYNNLIDPGISMSESINLAQAEEIMARAYAAQNNNLINNRALIDAGVTASSGADQIHIVGESQESP